MTTTGEATYTMPLAVPPGRAGMEPQIAVSYDSAGGDGFVGIGFSLAGFSAITRCPSNIAQDGHIRAVRYDGEDNLCLDGRRLVPVAQNGIDVEYRTFPDTFTRVIRHAWQSFNVFLSSGLRVEYGTTTDSKVFATGGRIRSWLVSRSVDRRGNFIAYSYNNAVSHGDGHTIEYTPAAIHYTGFDGTPALAPTRAIVFQYEDRPASAARLSYTRGMAVRSSRILSRIDEYAPTHTLVRSYRFTYEQGTGTGRMHPKSLTECAGDGACKPATRFWFSGGAPAFQEATTDIPLPVTSKASPMLLDLDGDGLDDLVIPDLTDPSQPESVADAQAALSVGFVETFWNVARNRGPAWGSLPFPIPAAARRTDSLTDQFSDGTIPLSDVPPELGTALDYDGDGRSDIFLHDIYGNDNSWYVLLARDHGTFERRNTKVVRPAPSGVKMAGVRSRDGSVHLADVDGDGMVDLIQCENKSPTAVGANDYRWELHRWTPDASGWEIAGAPIDVLYHYPCDVELQTVDLDADGKVDLVVPGAAEVAGGIAFLATYAALSRIEDGSWESRDTGLLTGAMRFLDVNGDGLPDAVKADGSHQLATYLNTGVGFAPAVPSLQAPILAGADTFFHLASPLDYNGDGRADLLTG